MIIQIDTDAAATVDVTGSGARFEQNTQLEGVEYLFRFDWVLREQCFYLAILDQDENPIAYGIRLVIGARLLHKFKDPRLPPGELFCGDLTQQDAEVAAPADLGQRVPLFYVTSDDPLLAA